MRFFTKKDQLIILSLILVIIFISTFNLFNKKVLQARKDDLDDDIDIEDMLEELEEDDETQETGPIMIHISGQVHNPGIIELELGSRVIDAVNLAGGLKKDADLDRMNLAKKLIDEEKIYIPAIGEEDIPIEVANLNSSDNSGNTQSKVNINTCTKEELITLPGIGEVTAGKILDYREENLFKIIDDIKNVSGIGEKKFEAIKELITVN